MNDKENDVMIDLSALERLLKERATKQAAPKQALEALADMLSAYHKQLKKNKVPFTLRRKLTRDLQHTLLTGGIGNG